MVVSIKTGFYAEMEIDMKKLENKCMLITYSDSMGHNLADLNEILDKYFKKAFKKVMVNPNANSHIEILCEKYFVLCTSSLLGVQNSKYTSEKIEIGMSKKDFLKLFGEPYAKEMITDRYNRPVERMLYQESLYD